MQTNIDYLQKEIDRLNKIIEAYDKFRELSHKELKEAKKTIEAYEEVQELSRIEQLSLYDKLHFQKKTHTLEDKIKKLLDQCPTNEEKVIELLKKEEPENYKIYSTLFYILTHHEFSEEEAIRIWREIKERQIEMQNALKRNISFRVAMLDYFISTNKVFKNPMTVEIQLFEQLQYQAIFDELTKVYNRRFILHIFQKELERAKRHKHELCIILFDIDNFKRINDVMGHLTGDKVLKLFSKVVKDNIRTEDSFGRIGGEEFLLILPETPIYKTIYLLERIRDILSEISGEKMFFTFSTGIAGYPQHADDQTTLLHLADKALLRSKLDGKNRDYIYYNGH
ncbi:MAG: hypothetical protein KatS3mg129_1585 [Leptospiraceae bacterium]|nr:MAG: hypothetical protein KatS3mg129_1585 [Leptospiraceae bacterium]